MRLRGIEAFPVRIPAGAPAYDLSPRTGSLEPRQFETALVRVTAGDGLTGWGEAAAPAGPEVVCAVVEHVLRPILEGADFAADSASIEDLWMRMYAGMRLHGHTGGYQLDAMAAVDIALWDLAGKLAGKPVCSLLSDWPRDSVRAWLDGTRGPEQAAQGWDEGFRHFQLVFDGDDSPAFWQTYDSIRAALGPDAEISVDAAWRLDWITATGFGQQLDQRRSTWLQNPLMPEFPVAHGMLSSSISTPIAIGACYHTRQELEPFFQQGGMRWVQPDAGHTGLTEGMHIARLAASYCMGVAPDIPASLGPRTAAALHFAAAAPESYVARFRPGALDAAAPYLVAPFHFEHARFLPPGGPGLGIGFNERFEDLLASAGH